jgi:hypothetical protein
LPTTLPSGAPAKPTEADAGLLAFAQSAELAVHDLYSTAADVTGFSDEQRALLRFFGANHLAYAQAIGGAIGKAATNRRDEGIYSAYRADMFTPVRAMAVLQDLENTLARTHTDLVGRLEAVAGAELAASIAMVEAAWTARSPILLRPSPPAARRHPKRTRPRRRWHHEPP